MTSLNIPAVAYVIVCWNNQDILGECVESINQQNYENRQIIMVDNGSTDQSVEFVRRKYPYVHVIETDKNNGFAIANNIGIGHAFSDKSCDYVALINTDARIDENWTTLLVDFAKDNHRIASLQTPTLDYSDRTFYDSFGITVDNLGRAVQIGYRSKKAPAKNTQVFGVNFAAAILTRNFIEHQPFNDYLDEDMWMYLEDVDFAARSTMMGWENWLVVGSNAYHMGSASSGKNPGFSVFMSYRNNLYVIIKNFPLDIVVRLLFGAIIADSISYYQLIRGRNTAAIKAILKGRLTSIIHFGKFVVKRRQVVPLHDIDKKKLRRLMDPSNFSMND